MPVAKLKNFLDDNDIQYVSIVHSQAFTAQQTAQSAHIAGKEMAKTVIVKIDGEMGMVVVPAPKQLDLELAKNAIGSNRLELAKEWEFEERFANCEIGAMPPFGNLYDMVVYVDESLKNNEKIVFNAGSHTELIEMNYSDFDLLVKPTHLNLTS